MTFDVMTGEENSIFGKLPPEVLLDVFKCLSREDRLRCRYVCLRWSLLATYGLKFLAKLTDDNMANVFNCSQKVETMSISDLARPLPLSSSRRLVVNFSFLRNIFFGINIGRGNMTKLLEQAHMVNTLGFTGTIACFPNNVTFNNLHCLQFQKMNLTRKETNHFKSLLNKSHFPYLKRANFVNVNCDFPLYLSIHRFVINHKQTLKNLIINAEPRNIKTGVVHERVRELYEPMDEYKQISAKLVEVQLETLWINAVNYEGLSPWNLGTLLVKSQKNLECLLLDGIWFWNSIQSNRLVINEVIEANCETLRRVKLPLLAFDCTLVRRCKQLTELGIYIHGDHLNTFGLNPWDGLLANVHLLPRSLKILDLHLPIEMEKILWITRNLKIQEIVFEGSVMEPWNLDMFFAIWQCPTLVKCRCWVKMTRASAKQLPAYYTTTNGLEGTVIFNGKLLRALVEANFKRPRI